MSAIGQSLKKLFGSSAIATLHNRHVVRRVVSSMHGVLLPIILLKDKKGNMCYPKSESNPINEQGY